MQMSIKNLHQELTQEARDFVEGKLRTLEKFAHTETAVLDCEIEESLEAVRSGARFEARGNLALNGKDFHAEGMSDTLEGAVDKVRDGLARELQKSFGKSQSLAKRSGRRVKQWLRFGR